MPQHAVGVGVFGIEISDDFRVFLFPQPGVVVCAAITVVDVFDRLSARERRLGFAVGAASSAALGAGATALVSGFMQSLKVICARREGCGPAKANCVRPLYYNGSWRHQKTVRKRRFKEHMAHEIEIKLHVKNPQELRAALKRLGAHLVSAGSERVHEWNVVFDTAEERLKTRGELLRIRTETPGGPNLKRGGTKVERSLLTFKRPVRGRNLPAKQAAGPRRHKIREEIELQIGDAKALTTIFEGLGLRGWFCYEKFRTTFRLPQSQKWAKGLLIELDETPIGLFLELEGPPKAIDRAARELGFARQDYIVTNYLTLYREECRRRGVTPRHMIFAKEK